MRIFFTFSSSSEEVDKWLVASFGLDDSSSELLSPLGTSSLLIGFPSLDSGITNLGFFVSSSSDIFLGTYRKVITPVIQ